jgi:fructose-1,6-bisphosphatase/inositol monophosphatase family enzyme
VALDLAYAASGALSLLVIANPARTFDFAAGMLILEEADGVITDINGMTVDSVVVGLERTVPLIASANERLHARALEILSPQS